MRVLITRPLDKAYAFADALMTAGLQPYFFPTIQISPVEDTSLLDNALRQLKHYSWVVFTSASAVEVVWGRLDMLEIAFPRTLCVAAVGPKTAASLKTRGIIPTVVPKEFTAEAILPGLGDVREQRILLPLADIAHDALPFALQQAGGFPHVVIAYHTLPARSSPDGLAALRAGVDFVTFTSGSTIRNFISLVRAAGLDPFALPNHPRIACIGPKTAAVARESGFQVDVVAEAYTVEGLVGALGAAAD